MVVMTSLMVFVIDNKRYLFGECQSDVEAV
jgi:hypothetical protein